jgi:hypothetical protein
MMISSAHGITYHWLLYSIIDINTCILVRAACCEVQPAEWSLDVLPALQNAC